MAVLLATNCFVLRQRHRFSPRCDWNAGAGISRIEPKGNVYYISQPFVAVQRKTLNRFDIDCWLRTWVNASAISPAFCKQMEEIFLGASNFQFHSIGQIDPEFCCCSLCLPLYPPPIFASPQNLYHFLLFMPQRWIALRQCDTHKLILNLLHFLFKMTSDSICLGLGK